jgi:DNA-directed RNA polymerase specialized sigma24 family protein
MRRVLVNELFLVLLNEKRAKFEDRVHFFTFAARTRLTAKRGAAGAHLELSPEMAWVDPEGPEMLDLDRALDEMESMEPRKARVTELRIFLGCTSEEAAALMGISKPRLDRDLRFALAWLFAARELSRRTGIHAAVLRGEPQEYRPRSRTNGAGKNHMGAVSG